MSKSNKQTRSRSKGGRVALIIMGICVYLSTIGLMIRGKNMAIINPKGLIAQQQHNLMMYTILVMLILAVPTITLIYLTAWRYRDTNKRAHYDAEGHHSKFLAVGLWIVPASFIVLLAMMMIPATHKLEPKKALANGQKPLTIQVVALRWKWLFIYPDQKIATVNYVQMPLDTPVKFELTADETPMSSFWMPNFGGQLYAMTGHVNRLNLIADTAGDYPGKSAEINGAGFSGMNFVAHAVDDQTFDKWVSSVQNSPHNLDAASYQELLQPSENNKPSFYTLPNPDLYLSLIHI